MKKFFIAYVILIHLACLLLVSKTAWFERVFFSQPAYKTDHYLACIAADVRGIDQVKEGATIFFGDSIVEGIPSSLFEFENYGIGRDTTTGLLARLDRYEIAIQRAGKIYVLIGINDLMQDKRGTANRIDLIRSKLPKEKTVFLKVLPTRNKELNQRIEKLNQSIAGLDVSELQDSDGLLLKEFTDDGVHLNGSGYAELVDAMRKMHARELKKRGP